jgi:hypothetical protein
MTSVTYAARTVGAVLATVHEGWINQVESSLLPATDPRTDFWSRWGATRFLGNQFGDRFRLECAFAAALESLLPPGAGRRLADGREGIQRTSEELMAAGRHWDAGELTAVLARRLLNEVMRWCVELELATENVVPSELPATARRLLARLRIAHALGR